ncbi:MAG TPA: restriction endonuclease, partial [Candidatus Altiarchaeales archaeon]|nr:restriction endonuclease [Candidatus Altiarchaeales archaeon]
MDDFERFWMEREREELEIEPEKLRKVLSKILKEFNLELKSIEETEEKDLVATCLDKLGREVTSLIRIRADTEGIERDDVEDFYEDMVEKRAVAAIFITTSYFFKDAKDFVEGLPIRLVDRTQLSEIIAEIEAIKVEKAFVSGMNDSQVVKYFQKKIKGRVLGRFGMPENIEEIDRRYLPIGFFSLKKIEENVERRKFAYIDLSSGDLFYIDEGRIKRDDFIKNILNLPPESREHLMDLIEHGELPHEHIDGKHLVILKKRGLLGEYEEGRGGGILSTMVNGIMSLVM